MPSSSESATAQRAARPRALFAARGPPRSRHPRRRTNGAEGAAAPTLGRIKMEEERANDSSSGISISVVQCSVIAHSDAIHLFHLRIGSRDSLSLITLYDSRSPSLLRLRLGSRTAAGDRRGGLAARLGAGLASARVPFPGGPGSDRPRRPPRQESPPLAGSLWSVTPVRRGKAVRNAYASFTAFAPTAKLTNSLLCPRVVPCLECLESYCVDADMRHRQYIVCMCVLLGTRKVRAEPPRGARRVNS